MNRVATAPAAVVLFACVLTAVFVLPHPIYTPDGMVYARYAARDAGFSERGATLEVRRFYERTPLMDVPRYRALVEIDPDSAFDRSRIFLNRVLYPALAAALLPLAGLRSLWLISAAAYVAFAAVLCWFLTSFARPWIAGLLTAAALALPMTRAAAASDLTDMLGILWWTIALAAIVRGMRERSATWPAILAAASVLLALTRPAPYLPLLPAAAAGFVSGSWMLLAAALFGVAGYAIVAALTHAFGIGQQLEWVYRQDPGFRRNGSESAWYRAALAGTIRYVAGESLRAVFPVLAFLAWILSLRSNRRDAIVLAAAALACCAAIPLNPVPSSIDRTLFLPLLPVLCAMFACGASSVPVIAESRHERGLRLYRRSAPAYSRRPLDRSQ